MTLDIKQIVPPKISMWEFKNSINYTLAHMVKHYYYYKCSLYDDGILLQDLLAMNFIHIWKESCLEIFSKYRIIVLKRLTS